MNEIKNDLCRIKLTVLDYDNNEIEVELMPWQVNAVVKVLGICVTRETEGIMELMMASKEYVEKHSKLIPECTWVKK